MVNHDRYGLFRPTQLRVRGAKHPEWATNKNLHFDANVWKVCEGAKPPDYPHYQRESDLITENNIIDLERPHAQGLINLIDNRQDDGGFW